MFTGLVRGTGEIVGITDVNEGRRIVVRGAFGADEIAIGASVSISGVCLTVVEQGTDRAAFEVAFETLRRTTLGDWQVGRRVNLEPSLRVGDPLGGHFVLGHVDGWATVRSSTSRGSARELWFDIDRSLMRFVAPKGSIALEGVSLTINDVDRFGFMVGLVPHTLEVTTLGRIVPSDRINVEVDIVARYLARFLETSSATPTSDDRPS